MGQKVLATTGENTAASLRDQAESERLLARQERSNALLNNLLDAFEDLSAFTQRPEVTEKNAGGSLWRLLPTIFATRALGTVARRGRMLWD